MPWKCHFVQSVLFKVLFTDVLYIADHFNLNCLQWSDATRFITLNWQQSHVNIKIWSNNVLTLQLPAGTGYKLWVFNYLVLWAKHIKVPYPMVYHILFQIQCNQFIWYWSAPCGFALKSLPKIWRKCVSILLLHSWH